MQCMSSVNCSKKALLVERPSVLKDWTRCTTCGTTCDGEGWREEKNVEDTVVLEGTANINHTNLQRGHPEGSCTYGNPAEGSVSFAEYF